MNVHHLIRETIYLELVGMVVFAVIVWACAWIQERNVRAEEYADRLLPFMSLGVLCLGVVLSGTVWHSSQVPSVLTVLTCALVLGVFALAAYVIFESWLDVTEPDHYLSH